MKAFIETGKSVNDKIFIAAANFQRRKSRLGAGDNLLFLAPDSAYFSLKSPQVAQQRLIWTFI